MSTEARALLYFAMYLRTCGGVDDAVSRLALANARRWAERIIAASCSAAPAVSHFIGHDEEGMARYITQTI